MYDIFFISKNSNHPEFLKLKERFIFLKLASSFFEAKSLSLTEFFWIIWDDLIVDDNFDFKYVSDNLNKDRVHVFLNSDYYDGITLFHKELEVNQKEIDSRVYKNANYVNVVASIPQPFDIFDIDCYDDYLSALKNSKTELFWMTSKNIEYDVNILNNFYIPRYHTDERNTTHAFVHNVDGQKLFNGVFLLSVKSLLSKKEIESRYPLKRKEHFLSLSKPVKYDIFEVNTYEDYLFALNNSKTEMFWATHSSLQFSDNFEYIYFSHDNEYDRKQNHAFLHDNGKTLTYNGVFLFSKHSPVSKREIIYRSLNDFREWDIIASVSKRYDVFYTKTYEDYLTAYHTSKTELFWIIPDHVTLLPDFSFNFYVDLDDEYSRTITHVFLNGEFYDGVMLCSKHRKLAKAEYNFNYIANKKEIPIKASVPKPYDVVFISYAEPNADENYQKLKIKCPNAKRVHGVTGIHQAHIEAAKLCNTNMFWVVDGDAQIVENFNFDYQVPRWDHDMVHVWRSINPINDLSYGYGGIKLFPRTLTLDMDITKPDMTTSISKKFKAVHQISNITAFNTDPFNTWKSAFRECCKLSSKVIDRQKSDETHNRLVTWCTRGSDRPYGKYAIDGAKMGSIYGTKNANNLDMLKKINDFTWLKEQFDARNI